MLVSGIINNCEKCGHSYGQYNENKENNFSDFWAFLPTYIKDNNGEIIEKPSKGICQFCNPKSRYFMLWADDCSD